jgi:hypothetical protein
MSVESKHRFSIEEYKRMAETGVLQPDSRVELLEGEIIEPMNAERLHEAIRRFDATNAADPNTEEAEGQAWPRELLYAHRLSKRILQLCPDASEELQLAARSQHICRWTVPRQSYPMTRPGYLKWRADLRAFHAEKAGQILQEVGYPDPTIRRVRELILKQGFPHDPEARLLEDALCLVFLEYQFAEFAHRTPREKVLNAVRKTWNKMTPAGQAEALKIPGVAEIVPSVSN